jgi:hypothetical protein
VRRRVSDDDGLEEHRGEIEALLTMIENSAPNILQSLESTVVNAQAMMNSLDSIAGKRTG